MSLSLSNIPNILPGTYGKAEISYIENRNAYFIHYEGIRWMCVSSDYLDAFNTLYPQYDIAYGKVLVTGLGFGILLKALEEKDSVTSITVIEKQQDIVDAYLASNTISNKTKILIEDATSYSTDDEYDCLLPDHYELQTIAWKIKDMNGLSKRIKNKEFWPWSIEDVFIKTTYPPTIYGTDSNKIIEDNSDTIYEEWQKFIHEYFDSNESLLGVKKEKLIEYLTCFCKYYV